MSEINLEKLKVPLPPEAITQHPTKTYLSSIKAIYVTERFNEVFWIWAWTVKTEFIENAWNGMIVVKVIFEVPKLGIYYESFWWNDNGWESNKNFDLWDAYKWATTDALTKIGSYLWVGIDVFKWKSKTPKPSANEPTEWMSDANFEAFRPFLNKFKSWREAVIGARKKYMVSKKMASSIEDAWTDLGL